jgi:organic radical activating enzyme
MVNQEKKGLKKGHKIMNEAQQKLKWLEVFYSIQGEGLRVGKPTVFIRLFGCNFTCQGFGMPDGELSNSYEEVEVEKFTALKSLPIIKTGCDSYAAWDPRCEHLTTEGTVEDLCVAILNCLGLDGKNPSAHSFYNAPLKGIDVVITGGEPMYKWQPAFQPLFRALGARGVDKITIESNGSISARLKLFKDLGRNLIWSFSPKLSESGESWNKAIKPKAIKDCLDATPHSEAYLKFVVSRDESVEEVKKAIAQYKEEKVDLPVYLMPTGGTLEEYRGNSKHVAEICLKNRWNYSPRLHVDLWGNSWGT